MNEWMNECPQQHIIENGKIHMNYQFLSHPQVVGGATDSVNENLLQFYPCWGVQTDSCSDWLWNSIVGSLIDWLVGWLVDRWIGWLTVVISSRVARKKNNISWTANWFTYNQSLEETDLVPRQQPSPVWETVGGKREQTSKWLIKEGSRETPKLTRPCSSHTVEAWTCQSRSHHGGAVVRSWSVVNSNGSDDMHYGAKKMIW